MLTDKTRAIVSAKNTGISWRRHPAGDFSIFDKLQKRR
jgi:hypothetical protein